MFKKNNYKTPCFNYGYPVVFSDTTGKKNPINVNNQKNSLEKVKNKRKFLFIKKKNNKNNKKISLDKIDNCVSSEISPLFSDKYKMI